MDDINNLVYNFEQDFKPLLQMDISKNDELQDRLEFLRKTINYDDVNECADLCRRVKNSIDVYSNTNRNYKFNEGFDI